MKARQKGIEVEHLAATQLSEDGKEWVQINGEKLTAGMQYGELLFDLIGLENEYTEMLNKQNIIDSALAGTIIGKTEALTAERDILVEAQNQTEEGSTKWLQYAEAIANVKEEMAGLSPEIEATAMLSEEFTEGMNKFQQGWGMIANTASMYFNSVIAFTLFVFALSLFAVYNFNCISIACPLLLLLLLLWLLV